MERSTLPPPHPSLPRHPTASALNQTLPSYYYPQLSPAYYNSHYVQAYSQPIPTNHSNTNLNYAAQASSSAGRGPTFSHMNSWYQPGSNHCTHPGCAFTGSHKSVELHMMDRHLIYPSDWERRKKKIDWDADPSLKGKPIPIQGTNVILDSPEVLEAWIAERKRRFPTSERVEEKKRKMTEAVARGQLDLTDIRANKRRKTDNQVRPQNEKFARSTGSASRNLELSRVPDSGWGTRSKRTEAALEVTKNLDLPLHFESDSEDDGEPEALSSKITPPAELSDRVPETKAVADIHSHISQATTKDCWRPTKKHPQQPKLPPRNPFASRPTLLRNLLLPEIRITISNLSQAIRFLVDNEFLQDIELKPGQAFQENKIQVLGHDNIQAGDCSEGPVNQ